ncbi:MAG: hypothetical protein ACRBBS_17495 [Thalassovita sp.]
MSIETPSIHNPVETAMRAEVTVTVQLVYDCNAERSKEQQTDDCKDDIGRLLDADETTGVALTGYTVTRVHSEAETYGTTAECSAEFQADRAAEALKSLYTDAENNPAELLEYILCDLRHFADKNSLNFAAVDRQGYKLYAEERGGKS